MSTTRQKYLGPVDLTGGSKAPAPGSGMKALREAAIIRVPAPAAEPASLGSLITITCGECRKASDALTWCERPISGDLPSGEYQCPNCGYAFRRERAKEASRYEGGKWIYQPINLVPVASRL